MTNEAIIRKAQERKLEAFYNKNRMAIVKFRMLLHSLRIAKFPDTFFGSDELIEKYAHRD